MTNLATAAIIFAACLILFFLVKVILTLIFATVTFLSPILIAAAIFGVGFIAYRRCTASHR